MPGKARIWVEKIEDEVASRPFNTTYGVAVGIAGTGVALGLLTSLEALLWVFGAVLVVLLAVLIALLARRSRRLGARIASLNQVLDHYARNLIERQESKPQMFSYARWDEQVFVSADGHGHLVRDFEIVVGSEPLDAFWNRSNGFLAGADVAAAQGAVEVSARLTDQDGAGVELNVTNQWEGARLRAFVHFFSDCPPGSTVRVRMEWSWPGLYENLVAGRTEPRTWKMQHQTDVLVATFTVAKELAGRNPAVSVEPSYTEKPTRVQNPDGSVTFRLEKSAINVGEGFGYLIQLPK